MRAKEPWQSRSPTGARNTFVNPDTLNEQGRKGPQHSYGRGLPVKRKALIILSIAILAFAMIPALGAGAASGAIKIVTPNEMVDPTNNRETDSFDQLQSAEYVSTATGGTEMEDTFGTLYVVIDDNDADANALTAHTAVFTSPSTSTSAANFTLANANSIYAGSHSSGIPTGATDLVAGDPTVESLGLNIGDWTRNGALDGEDIKVFIDYGTPERTVELTGTAISTVIDSGAAIVISTLYTNVTEMRVVFYSASTNELLNSDGSSRVEVRTTTDSINVLTSEKDLGAYAGTPNDGLKPSEFSGTANSVSKDSGTFVGAFGLIDTDWKDMLDAWVTRDGGTDNTRNMEEVTKTALLCTDAQEPNTNTPPDGLVDVVGGDGICDGVGTNNLGNVEPSLDSAKIDTAQNAQHGTTTNRDVTITLPTTDLDLAAGQYIADRNEDGMVDHRDITVTYNDETNPQGSITVKSFKFVGTGSPLPTLTNNVAAARLQVVVTLPALTTAEATTFNPADATTVPANKSVAYQDTITIKYATTANLSTLIDDIKATVGGDGSNKNDHKGAFKDLTPSAEATEAGRLVDALNDQERNLDALGNETASATTSASILINRLLGVNHSADIAVRYNDESAGIQTARAKVDTAAPTVKAISPADKSFTTDDRIDGLFSVTDADAGIPEDAEDVGRNNANAFIALPADKAVAFVTTSATINGNTATKDDFDPASVREEDDIDDGYTYEYRIDIPSAVVRSAQQNNQEVEIKLTVVAYDQAGNKASKTFTFTVDLIDPELLGALTGWSAERNAAVDRNGSATGAYVLTQNDRDHVVLIFNGPIDGASVDAADIAVDGVKGGVTNALWLSGSGDNVISTTGLIPEGQTGDPKPGQIATGANVSDDIEDDEGAGMALLANQIGQDARHLLFLTLSDNLATDAKPTITIDRNDVQDLAGNELGKDHVVITEDRLSPTFTVTVENKVSNGDLDVTIESSESLTRRGPTAHIVKGADQVALTENATGDTTWSVSANLSSLRLSSKGADDGKWTVKVAGEDEDGNAATSTKATWELDTTANRAQLPKRSARKADDGTKTQAAFALSLETNDVVFLNLDFSAETGEYTGDTKKKIAIESMELETLAADAITGTTNPKIVASPAIESTTTVDVASAQTADGIKHVVALSELTIGNYRLNLGYADEVGNTGSFGFVFKIVAPAPAKIDVVPGWSLVSIPGTPQDKSISGVLEGSSVTDVWSLDNETKVWEFARKDEEGEWTGTLVQMVDGRAYFVRSATFDPISVLTERFDPQRTPAQYTVTSGWNAIGYTPAGDEEHISVDGYLSSLGASGWGMIRTWDASATPPQYETYFSSGAATDGFPGTREGENGVAIVEEGKGYLLFATRNGVIGG